MSGYSSRQFGLLNEPDISSNGNGNSNERFDSTGMFHLGDEQLFENCILDSNKKYSYTSHVIACIFAEPNSPLIGLRNFVLPLRASNYYYDELKEIIFIGNKDFLYKEWKSICNFPKIKILPVNILQRFLFVP
jgi:potassium large conductance calcium-activated channel subfamily M alpha protein 1